MKPFIIVALTSLLLSCASSKQSNKSNFLESQKTKGEIAVLDFENSDGKVSVLGRYLADQITVDLAQDGKNSFVDRSQIKKILAEQNFQEGAIDADKAKDLGRILGAQILIVGNYYELGTELELITKALDVTTGKIIDIDKQSLKFEGKYKILADKGVITPTVIASTPKTKKTEPSPISSSLIATTPIQPKVIEPIKDETWEILNCKFHGFKTICLLLVNSPIDFEFDVKGGESHAIHYDNTSSPIRGQRFISKGYHGYPIDLEANTLYNFEIIIPGGKKNKKMKFIYFNYKINGESRKKVFKDVLIEG